MTNREFIQQQLRAFGVTESDLLLADIDDLDEEVTDVSVVEKAMIPLIAKLAVSPFLKSVNENGFSVSWDVGKIGWWYRYLCSKYGVTPDPNIESALGLSVIIDRTNKW
jgi:hypothetical protein